METQALLYAASALLILAGFAGIVLPVLPGAPLMFAGMLLGAWAGNFDRVGPWSLSAIGLLAAASVAMDAIAASLGAKKVGASGLAMVGAALGGVLGGLWFSLPGLVLGPFCGAALGELAHGGEWRHASQVGLGTWLGLIAGTAFKLALAFTMLGIFLVDFLWN